MGDAALRALNPSLHIVHDDPRVRADLERELGRRYGEDYEVHAHVSADDVLAALRRDADAGRPAAVVFSDESPAGGSADLLGAVHELHPLARRVLLIGRGEWSKEHPAVTAMRTGQVDSYIFVPWGPPERWLHLPVSEILADWEASQPPPFEAARIIGDEYEAHAHGLRDLFSRIGVPFRFIPAGSGEGRSLRAELGAENAALPLLAFRSGTVLSDPSIGRVVQALGFATEPDPGRCDVAIVGAGPAGLAAAVYAASEGLRTTVIEPSVPGGQAGTSSRIRNYLGFPNGLSGRDLGARALEQAWFFGARFVLARPAVELETGAGEHVVRLEGGAEVRARTVVIATGVTWHTLEVPSLADLLGAGVYYGAAAFDVSAPGAATFVVGGGNSAGQAAVHLARSAASVTLVVRGDRLGASMSDYLVRELAETPNIEVRLGTEVAAGAGNGRLERLTLRDRERGVTEEVAADALYVMIGARPQTDWLKGAVARDRHGYILTGRDLDGASWPLERAPMLMETSVPGVFAAGDVRHASIRRVASAVGGGSIAVQLVHLRLAELEEADY
jgi:thioredoxin reductase (NADPH)